MDSVMSPELKMKLSTQEAVYRLRNGSPDFRHALRERCRHQVKARRSALFDNIRNTRSRLNIQETLSEIFSTELNFLQSDTKDSEMEVCAAPKKDDSFELDLQIFEQIKSEIIQEQEAWILAEYNKYMGSEMMPEDPNSGESVACPLCLRCALVSQSFSVSCPNGCIRFPPHLALSEIYQTLQYSLQLHDGNCRSNAQFLNFIDDEISGLHLVCHDCSFFQKVLPSCT
nr:PREDICTED: RPA-interacting protein-like [Bemisia tabaci]